MNATHLFLALGTCALVSAPVSAQYTVTTVPSNYADISGSGTLLIDVGDDVGVAAPLGFTFDFCGTPLTSIGVSTNGYLTTGADLTDFDNDCIPDANDPNGLIAPFWDDYSLDDHGDIFIETTGIVGTQVTTIQWDDVGGFDNSAGSFNFQVSLYEADGCVEFQYGTMIAGLGVADGSTQTIGIEDAVGGAGTQVSCDTALDLTVGYLLCKPAVQPPSVSVPEVACCRSAVKITMTGEPGHLYLLGASCLTVPTYSIFGADFDLTPAAYLNPPLCSGIFDATGVACCTVNIPGCGPCGPCAPVYFQLATIGGFAPISGVQSSTLESMIVQPCDEVVGTLDADDQTSDLYQFCATAGDTVSFCLCRIGDQPDGSSLLDPRLCIYDSSGPIGGGLGVVSDDDSGGDCFASGPFGASLIEDWVVPATGCYTVSVSGWAGSEGPYELQVKGCSVSPGALTLLGDEVVGGCFTP